MVCAVVASMSPHVAGREGSEQGGTVGTKGTLATVVRWDGGTVVRTAMQRTVHVVYVLRIASLSTACRGLVILLVKTRLPM